MNDRVKNMDVVRPLIQQLHSPFMLERHWKRLMKICGKVVNFNSPTFCLNDIINLELFKFAEDVNELVDGASREAKIEQKLGVIVKTWEQNDFEFKEYKETKILGSLDEIMELCDMQSMDLMTMNSSKDADEFKDQLNKW